MVWWTKCLPFKLQDLNPKFSTHIKFWAQWQANAYITSTGRLVSSTYALKGTSGCPPAVVHMRSCSLKDQNQELAFTGSRPYRTLHSLVEFSPLEAEVQTLEQWKLRLPLLSSSKKRLAIELVIPNLESFLDNFPEQSYVILLGSASWNEVTPQLLKKK